MQMFLCMFAIQSLRCEPLIPTRFPFLISSSSLQLKILTLLLIYVEILPHSRDITYRSGFRATTCLFLTMIQAISLVMASQTPWEMFPLLLLRPVRF